MARRATRSQPQRVLWPNLGEDILVALALRLLVGAWQLITQSKTYNSLLLVSLFLSLRLTRRLNRHKTAFGN